MIKKFFFFILFGSMSFSQLVYEPLHRDIYSFLARISQKSIIEFDDLIRPVSRKYIAEKLTEISAKDSLLTELERDELEFFKSDFKTEIDFTGSQETPEHKISFLEYDEGDRLRLFSYRDNLFSLNVSPVLGIETGTRDEKQITHIWNGISAYGYLDDFIGFSFNFRDNVEKGISIDKTKSFSPVTGVDARTDINTINYPPDKMEYSEVRAVISADWDWGSFSAGKDFIEWGYGESGLLVLSGKTPSFGFIRLNIKPVDWLRFNYLHGWLSSDIADSNSFFFNNAGTVSFSYRNKFIASHSLSISPLSGLELTIGESIVYDDQLEFLYLMPIMFYRLADHHLSRQINAAGGNAQFFFSASSRGHIKNAHFYGTLFIDEITISGLFDSNKQRNQLGFTLGGAVTDMPIENLSARIEYTKIYPFVYNHYIQTQDYASAGYPLGHWMGHNSDLIYGSLNYRFMRGLQATVWAQYIRKGGEGNLQQQYNIQPQPPFLFGLRKNYSCLGAEIKYEHTHELFAKLKYQMTDSSIQQNDLSFMDTGFNEFYFSVYYGL